MRRLAPITIAILASSCGGETQSTPCPAAPVASAAPAPSAAPAAAPSPPTAEDAKQFVVEVDKELRRLWTWGQRAGWAYENNITDDTEALNTQASEANMTYLSKVIPQIKRFAGLQLPPEVARQLHLLRFAVDLPPPNDARKRGELADVSSKMRGLYGKGKYCPPKGTKLHPIAVKLAKEKDAKEKPKEPTPICLDLEQLGDLMKTNRDWDLNLEAFEGWHKFGREEKALYTRYVELANEGARDLGFTDFGDIWRSGYDMSAADFEKDTERLWTEVKPLYEQLHCYVRGKLRAKYGKDKIGEKAPIPAHIVGNMWAQEWTDLYPLVEPYAGQSSLDVTKVMVKKKWDERKVVKTAEDFFVGIGMESLPKTFWERSLFKKPTDREVVCHASAWDVQYNGDVRIKMCVQITEEDLYVAHHELGHDYYYLNYDTLPMLFQSGANDGFHEGIGDTMRLSVTPGYLKKIGLLDKAPDNEKANLNVMMKMALEKVAFLPFGKVLDQWRWDVFSGKIAPSKFNEGYWALRRKYQGVAPISVRGEDEFDPGAKFHVPANTPYTRYFLATIYQFQFHRALCKAAGHTGSLDTCSIAGSKAAGDKLKAMLALGASKPWPEAMKAITGSEKADATAMLEYFAPLQKFLAEKNKGEQCGW